MRLVQCVFDINLPKMHPETWAKDLLDSSFISPRTSAIAISVMWVIWSSRNKYTHEEIRYELLAALDVPDQWPAVTSVTLEKWKAPETGWIKINCDGGVGLVQGCAGAGMVARDHTGSFIRSRCNKYVSVSDSFAIKLLACRDALLLAIDSGFQEVIIETDCQEVVKLWHSGSDKSVGFHIFRDEISSLDLSGV